MNYWLMKSEPDVFSIDDLQREPKKTAHWDGVRNYQARNHMRSMNRGDHGFFYHSNCAEPGIVGILEVVREAYPDHTAFDPASKYYDPNSATEKPRWDMVDVRFIRRLRRTITLAELRHLSSLDGFALVRRGNRLSVMPVSADHWQLILGLED